jgi:NACalpha-BTF3-like transcription factor
MANEMNKNHQIDKRLQFDFLINTIRKQKRFSKWLKAAKIDDIELIKEYYGYSNEKARQALTLLNDAQLEELRKKVYKGGKSK